jgi:hypothetical protein
VGEKVADTCQLRRIARCWGEYRGRRRKVEERSNGEGWALGSLLTTGSLRGVRGLLVGQRCNVFVCQRVERDAKTTEPYSYSIMNQPSEHTEQCPTPCHLSALPSAPLTNTGLPSLLLYLTRPFAIQAASRHPSPFCPPSFGPCWLASLCLHTPYRLLKEQTGGRKVTPPPSLFPICSAMFDGTVLFNR